MDQLTCPSCGRSDFSHRWSMRNHHSNIHGYSLTGPSSIYISLRRSLPSNWNEESRSYKSSESYCENCGEFVEEGHVHHIIPVMRGGSNEDWNFMYLCQSCHNSSDRVIRGFTEPVLKYEYYHDEEYDSSNQEPISKEQVATLNDVIPNRDVSSAYIPTKVRTE